jgi:hypothetical protein
VTPQADTHECPYPGCTRAVRRSMLACRAHWYTVSKPTRDAVWAAYTGGSQLEHARAVHQATEEMAAHYAKRQQGATP